MNKINLQRVETTRNKEKAFTFVSHGDVREVTGSGDAGRMREKNERDPLFTAMRTHSFFYCCLGGRPLEQPPTAPSCVRVTQHSALRLGRI